MMQSQPPQERRTGEVFYGWWIVVAGFVLHVLNGGLLFNIFGVYVVLLQAEFGWSKTVLAAAFSLTHVESGILVPLQGWLVDRLGPRPVVFTGIVIFGAGFMLLSQVHSLLAFYAFFLLMAFGSSLAGFMTVAIALANWFAKKRATVMGIASAGMGVGGLLVPGLAWCLNNFGWRAMAFASGVAIIAIGLPAAWAMRRRPEDYGYLPDGDRAAQPELATKHPLRGSTFPTSEFTARQALGTRAFWFLALGQAAAVLVVGAVTVHLVPHVVEQLGVSIEDAGIAVAVLTGADISGRLAGGILGDRIDKRLGATGCLLGHSLALLILAYANSFPMVLLFSVVHGLSWGVRGPLLTSLRAEYFGLSSYGTILGFSSLVTSLGMILGPITAGVMADWLGNYQLGFTILACLAGLGSILFFFARKPETCPPKPIHPQR